MKKMTKENFMFDYDDADSKEDFKETDDGHRVRSSESSVGSGKSPLPTILKKPAIGIDGGASICNTVSSMNSASYLEDDPASSRTIPPTYTRTIVKGFGEDVDLYKDVLQVPKLATPREIRIAYFKRGREVLAEETTYEYEKSIFRAATVGDVSSQGRTRFQAVSMAYEILCNPLWKRDYVERGLVVDPKPDMIDQGTVDDSQSIDTRGDWSISVKSLPARPSIRWNEHVEELVFNNDPDEHSYDHKTSSRRKRKKRRSRIVIASASSEEKLDDHLAKLDREARLEQLPEEEEEPEYLPDFFDELEESLSGVLNLAIEPQRPKKDSGSQSSRRNKDSKKKKHPTKKDNNREYPETRSDLPPAVSPFDEKESDDKKQSSILSNPGQPNDVPSDEEASHVENISMPSTASKRRNRSSMSMQDSEGAAQKSTSSNPSKSRSSKKDHGKSRSSSSKQSKNSFGKAGNSAWDNRSIESDNDPFQSIESHKEEKASKIAQEVPHSSSARSSNNEDVFAGLEDEPKPVYEYQINTPENISVPRSNRTRAESPANGSISDLSESVILATGSRRRDAAISSERRNRGKANEWVTKESQRSNNSSGIDPNSDNEKGKANGKKSKNNVNNDGFDACIDTFARSLSFSSINCTRKQGGDSNDQGETKEATACELDDEARNAKRSKEPDGFMEYLSKYITAVVTECSTLGTQLSRNCEWEMTQNGFFSACVISDGDMDGLLKVLDKEMGQSSPLYTLQIR